MRGFQRIFLSIVITIGLGVQAFGQGADVPASPASPVPAAPAGDEAAAAMAEPAAPVAAVVPDDRPRTEIERIWFDGSKSVGERATRARALGFELGTANLEAAARALIARPAPEDELSNALLAARLAPDLPLVHMALARAQWNEGARREALFAVVHGLLAIPRHLEASLWAASTMLVIVTATLLGGSLFFMVFVGLTLFPHAAHDLADLISKRTPQPSRAALLAALLMVPVLLGEGVLGLTLGLFGLAFLYGSARHRMALFLATVLLVIAAYPGARFSGIALSALGADPLAQAVLDVSRGTATPAQLAMLHAAEGEDFSARLALAMRARREGNDDEALARYTALQQEQGADPVILTNLANLRFQRGETEAAIELYERSSNLVDSAGLMFNLSQAYAKAFRMDEFEAAILRAQELDSDLVAEFSRIGDSGFVADMALPEYRIRARMLKGAEGEAFGSVLRARLMPGMLGASWLHTAGGFVIVALFSVLLASRFDHASLCSRCGKRICGRCAGTVWNSEICDGCHHLFHRPETTDPQMRMARLAELRRRELRIEKFALVSSVLVPGAAGLWARRPDLSFVGVLLFAAAAAAFFWRQGVVPDPLAVGSAGPLAFLLAAIATLVGYLIVVASGMLIRRNA